MSGTLALSSFIASLDRDALIELIRARRVSSPNGVNDAIDLATELLKPDSIAQALAVLTRDELAALGRTEAAAEESLPPLFSRGLLAHGPSALPEVTESLDSLLSAHGISREYLDERTHLSGEAREEQSGAQVPETSVADTSSWYAAALTTTSQAAWLLRDIARTPAKLNRNGTIASVWVKSFEERLRIQRADELVELLRASNLAVSRGPELIPAASDWLALEHEQRWAVLARSAVAQMPQQVFSLLSGARAGDSFAQVSRDLISVFPLTTQRTLTSVDAATSIWERLGITVDGHLSSAGIALLRTRAAAEVQAGATVQDDADLQLPSFGLPAATPGVYIQPDLSVIVPGPLLAEDEALLAALTLPEQLGVASTLRITEASIAEAFDRGANAASTREFLERITLTGIPQPLDYLITALHQRAGSVLVSNCDGEVARTRIDFLRPELRSTVLVDRGLAHLQLHTADTEQTADPFAGAQIEPLYSRLRADHVLAALLDARYPAAAGSADPHPAKHAPLAAATSAASTNSSDLAPETQADRASDNAADVAAAIADRVLASASDGPGEISRQLTLAVRDRSTIHITLEMRGKGYEFTIVPVSLAAGRMRALDQAAGVERTIPVDAITSITQIS